MVAAYFLTAAIVSIWAYTQTRIAARNIRASRGSLPCPLEVVYFERATQKTPRGAGGLPSNE